MTTTQGEASGPAKPLLAGLEDGAIVMIAPDDRRLIGPNGEMMERPRIGVRLRYRTEGEVVLRDGRIAGGDLLCDGYNRVFARRVEPGTYPMVTVYAETARDSVAAFGVIRLADETADKCKLALFEGEDPSQVTEDMAGGLGTDSGTIALGGPEPLGLESTEEQHEELHRRIDLGFAGNALGQVTQLRGGTVCVWQAGFGDGSNTPYWGIGRQGKLCFLAVDFDVVANGLFAPSIAWGSVGDSFELQPAPRPKN